jgi:hypothetical protein
MRLQRIRIPYPSVSIHLSKIYFEHRASHQLPSTRCIDPHKPSNDASGSAESMFQDDTPFTKFCATFRAISTNCSFIPARNWTTWEHGFYSISITICNGIDCLPIYAHADKIGASAFRRESRLLVQMVPRSAGGISYQKGFRRETPRNRSRLHANVLRLR